MPKSNDRQIIERLTNDSTLEMNRDELERLLEQELSKPAEEIDGRLVGELLDVLQPEEMPEGAQQKAWANIQRRVMPKPRRTSRVLKRMAAVAAVVIALFGMTIGAAQAFRWTFLLKLLQPMAETFGIYMNYPDHDSTENTAEKRYTMSEDENTTVIHKDLSEIPDTYGGYAIKPGWIPEGYAFEQATSFEEINLVKYSIEYLRETNELNIFVAILVDPESVTEYRYERVADENFEQMIGSRLVTFYRNTDDDLLLVSWIEDRAHYTICGNVAFEEMQQMVAEYPERESE